MNHRLWRIAVALIILRLLGLVTGNTMGLIQILRVIAIIVVLVRVIQERKLL